MKKPLAIALLVIGGLAAVFGTALLGMTLLFTLKWGVFIDIALVFGMAFGGYCLSKLFRRRRLL